MTRKITDTEQQLWKKVTDTAKPLSTVRVFEPKPATTTKPTPNQPKLPSLIKAFEIGSRARPDTAVRTPVINPAPQMDAKAFTKLKRGRLRPEATLDLHGLTVAQAHPELVGFVMNASARGFRLVLVISGKGKAKENTDFFDSAGGVLRRSVPMWLKQAPACHVILEVTEAHQKHGGGGAYYVYLKRRR